MFLFSSTVKPRESANVIKEKKLQVVSNNRKVTDVYQNFEEFCNRITKLKLPEKWGIVIEQNNVHVFQKEEKHEIPFIDIYIENDLLYTIRIYAWFLPQSHIIYSLYQRSVKNITLSNLIIVISNYVLCPGSVNTNLQNSFTQHSVPLKFKVSERNSCNINQTTFYRSNNCEILIKSFDMCVNCNKLEKNANSSLSKKLKRQEKILLEPAKPNAPVSKTSSQRIKLTLQQYRIENKELKTKIENLKDEIAKNAHNISDSLNNDLVTIMSEADQSQVPPFMKFFWEEQQKYVKSSAKGIRYHPMVIRYCLALASKSASAYDDIRYNEKTGTGILILPSRRRLRDYKNYIRPERGFNKNIIKELQNKTKNFSDVEKFMVLLMDEMKIQSNLVWDKHTGELIGYVDLGDIELNYAALEKTDNLANHILAFLIRSVVNPFKFSLANFATTGATSAQMFPLLWKAISILELNSLKVIAVTCDGAAPNRKVFTMHSEMTMEEDINPDVDITYRTDNLFSDDKRFIYFFSDVPHLIKTARNCLANSGHGRCTRYMWNDDHYLIWNHIADFFYEDQEYCLHYLPKITKEHIKLTPYSIMNVKLAAQVLSSTVSNVLNTYGPPEAAGTAKFCAMMDTFFDILNIRNIHAHEYQQKPALAPFTSTDDTRFSWLQNVFLQYFEDWLTSIQQRPGNFTPNARTKMFITWQTHEGLKRSVHSMIEATKFLLHSHVRYVLTERFCQDPLENYFGHQRSHGARKDNPSVRDFGYNDNTIRNQKVFRPIAGNVQGQDHGMVDFSDEPVPSRKKPRKQ